jgi:hypothetical protein
MVVTEVLQKLAQVGHCIPINACYNDIIRVLASTQGSVQLTGLITHLVNYNNRRFTLLPLELMDSRGMANNQRQLLTDDL